ncbi:MAG TPA: DUF5818 domain-containing protein [Candidatus Sulfotelmatobacter sp.]|nr:DUF5818 domain-containing protein [Candidatus Sulfotelmatobacter sp.]
MRKAILLTFTLLCCTAWVAAQSTSPSSSSPAGSQSTGQTGSQTTGQSGSENGQMSGQAGSSSGQMGGSNHTTLRGCLSSSGGGYTLTDASGTQYQLTGDTSKLSQQVNHEVEVKGNASGSSASMGASTSTGSSAGSESATGSTGAGQMFNVTKVKKISGTCSSGTTGSTNR